MYVTIFAMKRKLLTQAIFLQGRQLEFNFQQALLKTLYFFDTFHIKNVKILVKYGKSCHPR